MWPGVISKTRRIKKSWGGGVCGIKRSYRDGHIEHMVCESWKWENHEERGCDQDLKCSSEWHGIEYVLHGCLKLMTILRTQYSKSWSDRYMPPYLALETWYLEFFSSCLEKKHNILCTDFTHTDKHTLIDVAIF